MDDQEKNKERKTKVNRGDRMLQKKKKKNRGDRDTVMSLNPPRT